MDQIPPNSAAVRLRVGKAKFGAHVTVTPSGILAISALVSSILLSTAVLVWAAKSRPARWSVAPTARTGP